MNIPYNLLKTKNEESNLMSILTKSMFELTKTEREIHRDYHRPPIIRELIEMFHNHLK